MDKDNIAIVTDLERRVAALENTRRSDEKMWALAAELLEDNMKKLVTQEGYDNHYKKKLKERKEAE